MMVPSLVLRQLFLQKICKYIKRRRHSFTDDALMFYLLSTHSNFDVNVV